MEKPKTALHTLVDKVRDDVLELLRLLHREEALGQNALLLFLLTLLRLEFCIYTHEPSHSAHIFIRKSLQVLQNALL